MNHNFNISGMSGPLSRLALTLLIAGASLVGTFAATEYGIGEGYDPESPGNPGSTSGDEPLLSHTLEAVVNPKDAGSVSSRSQKIKAGETAWVSAYGNSGFKFQNWTIDGKPVSTNSSYSFVMPDHDVTIIANFVFDPESPGNPSPEEQKVKHPLIVNANPKEGGSMNPSGTTSVEEGDSRYIYAYPNSGWEFTGWVIDGKPSDVASSPITITMGEKAIEVTANFEYNPANPGNPGANDYNSTTGEVVIDDFKPGYLYSALTDLVGYDKLSGVISLIVKGEMNPNDIGCLGYLNEAGLIDISRTGGVGTIPSRTFSAMKMTQLELPSTIGQLDSYVFSGCDNLANLVIYAAEPPICNAYTFSDFDNKENLTVYVPGSAIELYSNADYWKDFVILPIATDSHILQVSLPEYASDGRYRNHSIELVNLSTAVKQKYVVSDRLTYSFNGLRKDEKYNVYLYAQNGIEIGRIENLSIPDRDMEIAFDNLIQLYTVSASVKTPDGNDVTGNTTIEWLQLQEDGSSVYLRKATSVSDIPEGQTLICHVTLDSETGMAYIAPDDAEITVSGNEDVCLINLKPFRNVSLSGTVVNDDGATLPDAAVSATQTLNGKYPKTYTAKTDSKGIWSLNVLDAPETRLTFAASECVNVNDTIGRFEATVSELDLGKTILKSIVGARISYGFTHHAAGVEEVENYYADYQNVAVSVYNITQDRPHNDISLQYPILAVLDENINTGDELRLTATSKTGAFNPIVETVTVGDNQRAEVTFDIVGKGGMAASFEMTENHAVIAMLYGSNGELLKKSNYAEAQAKFTELEDGDYTLVSMGQSDLMSSILRLSNYDEIGLTEGKDYVKNAVTVESGKLAEVKNPEIPIFDESLFYYTNSSTNFSSNKSSITTGNYLTLRAAVDFKGIYKDGVTNVALVIDLPESSDLVEQSVIQGPNLLPYTYDNHRLTVQLGDTYTTQTRFCVVPTKGGSFNATASVVFDYNGKTITQPIGAATSEIKDLEIVVPSSTAHLNFRASGTSSPKSEIKVFVDGILSGNDVADKTGNWTTTCDLPECDNFSTHYVYAEIIRNDGIKISTETKEITYNPYDVKVRNVLMTFWNNYYKRQYNVTWDFEQGKISDSKYDFYTTTDMTFMIDIDYHDLNLIPLVWLHIKTSDGNTRSLEAVYDEQTDKWTAIDEFSSNALPTNVSVTIENLMFAINEDASYNLLIDQYIGDIDIKDSYDDEDGHSHISYVDGSGDELGEIESYETPQTPEEVIDDLKEQGFELDEDLNDDSDYVPEDSDDVLEDKVTALTDSVSGSIAFVSWGRQTRVAIIRLIKEEGKQSHVNMISSTISKPWKSFHRQYFDKANCELVKEYFVYTRHFEKYVKTTTSTLIAYTIFINPKLLPPSVTKVPAKQVIAKIKRIRHFTKNYTTHTVEQTRIPKNCPPTPPKPPTPPTPPVNPILDPSGYVYEAVPTNRVQGVEATIYYKETKEDMYGDPYEEVVLWDAEEYAQENPLFTDEYGMYQWDVPQGLWQVKFEKDGYATAYSEWLPVPPPQLEVNIGITQNKQPEVTEARAYEEGVEVQFDKFMDLSTLTTDNIYVTANNEKLNGSISLIDSSLADEYADEEDADATRFASRIRFVPEQPLSVTTGEIRLTVSRNVLSYAGIPMAETFSQTLDVEKEVQTIAAEDVKVLYGGEKEITIFALPYEAAVGRTLRISTSSDLITSIDKTEAVIDEEGKATVIVKGELPGRAQLSFSIDDVTATGDCAVDVVTEIINAEAPKASRASGTVVYRGSKVELTTDSKDGIIYFTTDGSCPCDEDGTRRKYTVPIVINEDTHILAMTTVGKGDGDTSEVVEFNYSIKHTDIDLTLNKGWTWISHNLENPLPVTTLTADRHVQRVLSQTEEVIRDPELGLTGKLSSLNANSSYKVETSSETVLPHLSDVAWNPATAINLNHGWNWIGYPVAQTMTVDEALLPTDAESLDIIVGQNGFAQFDGENWIGTLVTMSPGLGYLYQSQADKQLKYNTSIVSKAASRKISGITNGSEYVVDIYKYSSVMPLIATLTSLEGAELDNADYHIYAFCESECRGIGKLVNGLVMMSIYGEQNDKISFTVTDTTGETTFSCNDKIIFKEDMIGNIFEPYSISINAQDGVESVKSGNVVQILAEGDKLLIKGVEADSVSLVEMFDIDGHRILHTTSISESGIRISGLAKGVYVVVVRAHGKYSYHKIAISK